MFPKSIHYALEKLGKSKSGFKRTVVSKFKRKRRVGSGNELVDYSRAPCLGADQKARGLWERDWKPTYKHRSFSNSAWPKLAHGYHMIVVLLLFQLKSSALKGSFISVQMFSTVIFPHLISFTLFKTNETHLIFSWMNGVSFPTNNPQSTRSQKNLKTEVSVWKRIKCFSSRLSRSSRALKKSHNHPFVL